MSAKWTVERAGGIAGTPLRGWLAIDQNGNGYYLPTWREAYDRALDEATDELAREMASAALTGLMKARARSAR